MKIVDAFCGSGGLSLGFQMCGHDVVFGIDNNRDAIKTFSKNFPKASVYCGDIEKLDYSEIPDADIIVGGPPCVNFSTSKGSRANVLEGLKLVQAFLRLVWVKKPKYWIMENVPRVGMHLPERIPLRWIGIDKNGFLDTPIKHEFLVSEYGAPQKRRRLLIGNYPIPIPTHTSEANIFSPNLLPPKTLGDVINALTENPVVDPNYGILMDHDSLADHIKLFLSNDEAHRIKEAKTNHPYMGWMPFPDNLNALARTVVSLQMGRETLVIKDKKKYRRATVRECATLQTFPINFNFHGKTIESRYKQAGNAVPPILSYSIAKLITKNEGIKLSRRPYFYKGELAELPVSRKRKERAINFNKPRSILFPGKEIRGFRIELSSNPSDKAWEAFVFEGEGKGSQIKVDINAVHKYAVSLCKANNIYDIAKKIILNIDRQKIPNGKAIHEFIHENPTDLHPYIKNAINLISLEMPKDKYSNISFTHNNKTIFTKRSIRSRLAISIIICHHIKERINSKQWV